MGKLTGKTAFVLAGGGSLGAVQVGMLQALVEAGVTADLVVGSSVGALNAGFFAGDPTARGVADLAQIWRGLRRRDIFPLNLGSALRWLGSADALFESTSLRRVIERNLPYGRLEDAAIPVHVVATNLGGLSVRLSAGPAVEAILASAAIPMVFPSVEIGAEYLMDGAVSGNTPILTAVEMGAERLIVLPTGFACALTRPARRRGGARLPRAHPADRPPDGARPGPGLRRRRGRDGAEPLPAGRLAVRLQPDRHADGPRRPRDPRLDRRRRPVAPADPRRAQPAFALIAPPRSPGPPAPPADCAAAIGRTGAPAARCRPPRPAPTG